MSKQYILVINCGSSSLKFALYNTSTQVIDKKLRPISSGIVERKKQTEASITIKNGDQKNTFDLALDSTQNNFHQKSLNTIIDELNENFDLLNALIGVGHRVVHGGNKFNQSVVITNEVLAEIEACSDLAPLHNPANIIGIRTLQTLFPTIKQIAVFDTAFHQTMPSYAYTYAIPKEWSEKYQIRRYGFHGTSHRYITQEAALFLDKPISNLNIVSAHLGNGASVAAIKNGKSVDTSMGLTPLEGLVMGTRSGDIDPGIFDFLLSKGISVDEINLSLNKKSGLLGISGLSHDMRALCKEAELGNHEAQLAIDVFCFRAAKYIASMAVSLPKIDALVFTGGIGENAATIREEICKHLDVLGISLNSTMPDTPKTSGFALHQQGSVPVLVIPTDEELMIVNDTYNLIH